MNTYIPRLDLIDRYDDGVSVDYASMIRMWSAFDRSISTFNRRCGVVPVRRSADRRAANETGKVRNR